MGNGEPSRPGTINLLKPKAPESGAEGAQDKTITTISDATRAKRLLVEFGPDKPPLLSPCAIDDPDARILIIDPNTGRRFDAEQLTARLRHAGNTDVSSGGKAKKQGVVVLRHIPGGTTLGQKIAPILPLITQNGLQIVCGKPNVPKPAIPNAPAPAPAVETAVKQGATPPDLPSGVTRVGEMANEEIITLPKGYSFVDGTDEAAKVTHVVLDLGDKYWVDRYMGNMLGRLGATAFTRLGFISEGRGGEGLKDRTEDQRYLLIEIPKSGPLREAVMNPVNSRGGDVEIRGRSFVAGPRSVRPAPPVRTAVGIHQKPNEFPTDNSAAYARLKAAARHLREGCQELDAAFQPRLESTSDQPRYDREAEIWRGYGDRGVPEVVERSINDFETHLGALNLEANATAGVNTVRQFAVVTDQPERNLKLSLTDILVADFGYDKSICDQEIEIQKQTPVLLVVLPHRSKIHLDHIRSILETMNMLTMELGAKGSAPADIRDFSENLFPERDGFSVVARGTLNNLYIPDGVRQCSYVIDCNTPVMAQRIAINVTQSQGSLKPGIGGQRLIGRYILIPQDHSNPFQLMDLYRDRKIPGSGSQPIDTNTLQVTVVGKQQQRPPKRRENPWGGSGERLM